jgi:hypothetical protein
MIVDKAPVLRDVVDPLHAIHVARRDGVQRGQVARMPLGLEPCADGGQHRIRAAQRGGGRHGHHRAVRDARGGFVQADELAHAQTPP